VEARESPLGPQTVTHNFSTEPQTKKSEVANLFDGALHRKSWEVYAIQDVCPVLVCTAEEHL
jgi:hypothetical protein